MPDSIPSSKFSWFFMKPRTRSNFFLLFSLMYLISRIVILMDQLYKYRYTQFGTIGCLPTHKIYINKEGVIFGNIAAKFVFADNTFIYGVVTDWFLKNSNLDTRKSDWNNEENGFTENEKRLLKIYKDSHPLFKTEFNTI